jgi:arylformamidase
MTQVLGVTRIFDVSVPVVDQGLVYPGNPAIHISPASEMSKGASSNLSQLSFGSHTGTHVDAPKHFFDAGSTVDRLPLNALIGPAMVIAYPDDVMSVTADHLKKYKLDGIERVLIRTRNSGFIRERAFHPDFTFVAPDGADYLASIGVKLVGVDYLSVEQFHSDHHKTHRTLLERGIVIVEGLDLSEIAPGEYAFCCLPLRLEGLDGAPARAVLMRP